MRKIALVGAVALAAFVAFIGIVWIRSYDTVMYGDQTH